MSLQNSKDNYLSFLLICLGITIQQSVVIAGFNLSLSDVFLVLLCFHVLKHQRSLMTGKSIVVFFILLLFYRFIVTFILINLDVYISISMIEIISSILKMTIIFIYFIVGYNFMIYKQEAKAFFTAYVIFSMIVSLICIVGSITNASVIKDYFFFDDVRAQGLMNDPNYFALTQLVALCMSLFLLRGFKYKWLPILVSFGGVLASGSKTSLIILIFLFVITLCIRIIKISIANYLSVSILVIICILVAFLTLNFNGFDLNMLKGYPALDRMLTIFSEGTNAIDENGSNRSAVWENGMNIIQNTHGLGVGLYNYSNYSFSVNHIHEVVHNTYLQIMAEWGIIFAFALFFYLMYLFILTFKESDYAKLIFLVSTFFVILVYSFTVSLNNSRFIAISLGMIAIYVQYRKKERSADHET